MKRIRVVGTGIKGIKHLTLDAIDNFFASKKTLLFFPQKELVAYFKEHNLHSEDITNLYVNGNQDMSNYTVIVTRIFDEVAVYDDIAFCLPGHPRFGVTLIKLLKERAHSVDTELTISLGLSSFDTMLDDTELDPLEHGTSIVDANLLILLDYNIEPSLNYFLYHICSVGTTRTFIKDPTQQNAIHYLKAKLLKHYPKEHIVRMVSSAEYGRDQAIIKEVTMENLETLLPDITFSSTLFIPYIKPEAKRLNRDFLAYLQASIMA
ncbi:hypothetical protein [Photorhabdus bodei]|uniref:Tetrapyrrole methylase domain-containing protein n=1 Tax=Photorhabdus bodei TaxID=2029681 RepID=A0A329XC48_9GAMM|nr:hypothetical protein [Photorhabdus bodei]NDL00807.1 hypothetical protein [Photorhabdus bodei]NDL04973.1 hypothetical protein [Photorhabdus bodei]NDL09306.1 hypothetical protein [Photorhabdus bodei]RAX13580.1 hypothetical protein CKY02_05535 [Photorhabdus bodei]